jgi:hypothetical protein
LTMPWRKRAGSIYGHERSLRSDTSLRCMGFSKDLLTESGRLG